MMAICENDVIRYEALRRGSAATYFTLLESRVREIKGHKKEAPAMKPQIKTHNPSRAKGPAKKVI